MLTCWFPAGVESQLPPGVELQSRVRELQLPVFNPNSGRGENVRKQAVELPRGDEDKGNEELASALGATSFILGESLPVVPEKLVKRFIKGDYLDMAEMLSDNMEVERWRALAESEGTPSPRSVGFLTC